MALHLLALDSMACDGGYCGCCGAGIDEDGKMSEWQPIKTAPKDGTPIYLWAKLRDFEYRIRPGYFDDGWRQEWRTLGRDGGLRLSHPTHWMPLRAPFPTPPKHEGGQSDRG